MRAVGADGMGWPGRRWCKPGTQIHGRLQRGKIANSTKAWSMIATWNSGEIGVNSELIFESQPDDA
jgi:hypothetical protein